MNDTGFTTLRIDGRSATPDSTSVTVIERDSDGYVSRAQGTSVPSAESGYAKGCRFIKTNGSTGTTEYLNEGTSTTSDFNATGGSASNSLSALSDTDISSPGSAHVLIYDGTNSWDNKAISGDISLSTAGAVAISTGVIVNADVKSDAAIAFSKLAALDDAYILVGSGANVATKVAVSGDVTLANDGGTTVTDLTISSEAQGDVLYFDGTNWVRLGCGTNGQFLQTQGAAANPTWATVSIGQASGLTSPFTMEGGTYDPATTVTTQTSSAAALTVPDLGGVAQEWMFTKKQQTVLNKILDDASVAFGDTADTTKDLFFSLGGATTGKTMTIVSSHTDDRTITLPDDTQTLATIGGTETLTGKTLTSPTMGTSVVLDQSTADYTFTWADPSAARAISIDDPGGDYKLVFDEASQTLKNKVLDDASTKFGDTADTTKDLFFSLGGATSDKTMTIVSSQTDDRSLTLPDATDTLVGKATTDVFTNKSFDCDGTGNVLTNVNANELDPVGNATYGIPFVIRYTLSNQAAAVSIYTANAPFKFRILDAWSVATSADGGTWALDDGTNTITNSVSVAAADTDIDRPTDIDDAYYEIAANGSLRIVPDAGGALDCEIYILCMRVD